MILENFKAVRVQTGKVTLPQESVYNLRSQWTVLTVTTVVFTITTTVTTVTILANKRNKRLKE